MMPGKKKQVLQVEQKRDEAVWNVFEERKHIRDTKKKETLGHSDRLENKDKVKVEKGYLGLGF